MQKMVARLIEENQSFQENITQLEEELDQVDGMHDLQLQTGWPRVRAFIMLSQLPMETITLMDSKSYTISLTMQITPAKIDY